MCVCVMFCIQYGRFLLVDMSTVESVLHCVAVCYSVFQCVVVRCGVLCGSLCVLLGVFQRVAVCLVACSLFISLDKNVLQLSSLQLFWRIHEALLHSARISRCRSPFPLLLISSQWTSKQDNSNMHLHVRTYRHTCTRAKV